MAPAATPSPAQRPSIVDQYQELELSYVERRNQLHDLESRGKIPADMIPHRHRRLQKLRAARETLYRLALAEAGGDAAKLVKPQDFAADREHAA